MDSRARTVPLVLLLVLTACSPAAAPTAPANDARLSQSAQAKTITVALQGEPASVLPIMGGEVGGSPAGHVNGALHHRLTTYDNKGNPIAQLATEIPSLERGSWVLNPDGTMQT